MCRVGPCFRFCCVSCHCLHGPSTQPAPETGRTTCTSFLREPHGFCTRVCTCIPVSFILHSSSFRSPSRSPKTHDQYVKAYGRNIRIRGIGPVGVFEAAFVTQLTALHHSGKTVSSPLILFLCTMCSRIVPSTRNLGSHAD